MSYLSQTDYVSLVQVWPFSRRWWLSLDCEKSSSSSALQFTMRLTPCNPLLEYTFHMLYWHHPTCLSCILMTNHFQDLGSASDKIKQFFNQSEALPRSGQRHIISIEFLRLFLRCHFREKQWWHHNVSCFVRLNWFRIGLNSFLER